MTRFSESLWLVGKDPWPDVEVIDQRKLPFEEATLILRNLEETARAIETMVVRGAPLIGITAAYGLYLALRNAWREDGEVNDVLVEKSVQRLLNTRPTAVNLQHVLKDCGQYVSLFEGEEKVHRALERAHHWRTLDVKSCSTIGDVGLPLIRHIAQHKQGPVNILTHCNAGRLGCIRWGTALSPIYKAHEEGIDLHVWVDETRPRNQGLLTAWELGQEGVPHTVIADNAGGLLMMQGKVDMVIVGADRVARNGDVANKIGTYLKALAAYHHRVPFYVALPHTTFDPDVGRGADIPIEYRDGKEITTLRARCDGHIRPAAVMPEGTPTLNPAFDITPARYVTAYVTDRGLFTPATIHTLQ